MATTTARLQLVIAGENKGAAAAIGDTEKRLGGLQGKLGGLGAGLAGAFSVGAVVAFGKASVSAYSDIAGNVAQIKRLTGESAQDSSLLAFAAQQSGIDAAKAAVAWRTLAKNIDSGKVAAEGIATTGSNGQLLTFDEILGNVADTVQALPPGFQRTALAQRLFGKSGADMVKVLQNGRQGIEDLRSEMQSYGLEFSDAGLAKYTEFVKAQRDMKAALMGIQVTVAEGVVPVLTKMAEAAAFFGRLPEPVKDGALAIGGLALAVGGLNLLYGALVPLWDRGFVSIVRNATATASLAGAEALAAEAAAAEAAATAALATALAAAGPAEAEFAAAASARAAASTAAAAASEAEAAASTSSAGGLVSLGAAAGPLALAMVAVGGAFAYTQVQAKHSKDNVDDLVKSIQAGADPIDAFREKLVRTLHHAEGGFSGLGGSSKDFAKDLDELGLSGGEVSKALTGSASGFDAFIARIREAAKEAGNPVQYEVLIGNLKRMRSEGKTAAAVAVDLAKAQTEGAAAAEKNAKATDDLRTAHEKVNDRVTEAVAGAKDLASARDAEVSAQADSVRANYELAEARKAAAGNSDEYRDAEKAVAEAVAEIPDAQRAAAEAVDSLADARENAAEKIRDLARAEREAALASADAALRVKEAENEQRRVNADPRSSALQKERAALEVAQAREEARGAKQDANQAAADAAEAQRKGIEGDAEVVKARQSVADANDGVRDAVNRVREAEATAAQVIVDAKAKVLEAQAAATDAALNEASAWGDLVTKQHGAVAGAQAYRDKLAEIAADLDPSSPLAQRIARLIADINGAISTGLGQNPSARPPTRNPDAGLPTTDGAGAPIKAPPAGGDSAAPTGSDGGVTVHLEQHNTYQGTPTQQRRANDQQARRTLNGLAWGLR